MIDPIYISGLRPNDVIENKGEADFYSQTDRQVIEENKPILYARQPFTHNGKTNWIEISKIPRHDEEGNVIGLLGTYEDITDRMSNEAEIKKARFDADQSNKAKSMFLANISHEIRTPINGIVGMSELLSATPLSEDQQQYTTAISVSAENLLQLVNDLLDLSKIEANKMTLMYSSINLRELVDHITVLSREKALAKNINFTVQIGEDIQTNITGCSLRINQILTNLIGNAIKFTDSGTVTLKIAAVELQKTNCRIRFSVEDTGIGIKESELPNIWQSFEQEDNTTTQLYGGTGLGLTICKKMVDMMDGIISVESQKGEGSIFSFELPFELDQSSSDKKQESSLISPKTNPQDELLKFDNTIKVLLAEDDHINRRLAITVLSRMKCNVHAVINGSEAVEAFKTQEFDLIFMDCQMPITDGYEATKIIRELEKDTTLHIPIVAMTANVMTTDKTKCIDAGMDHYIPKPIKKQALINVLNKLFATTE